MEQDREITKVDYALWETFGIGILFFLFLLLVFKVGSTVIVAYGADKATSTVEILRVQEKTESEKLVDTNTLLSKYAKELASCKRSLQ